MVTQDQAEKLSNQTVTDYVNQCDCQNLDDVEKVLIKLISMTAHAIVATSGLQASIDILTATRLYLLKNRPRYSMEKDMHGVTLTSQRTH